MAETEPYDIDYPATYMKERLMYVGGTPIKTNKQMRPRDKDDFYETDPACIRAYLERYPWNLNHLPILDPGYGNGAFGKAIHSMYPDAQVYGIELARDRFPEHVPGYTACAYGDFLTVPIEAGYKCVIGNPPYKHAEEFFHKARTILKNGTGNIDFLLRLGFLESETRYKSMWTRGYKPTVVTVLNTRPSFTGNGKTYPAAFAFFRWEFTMGVCNERSQLDFLTFDRNLDEFV